MRYLSPSSPHIRLLCCHLTPRNCMFSYVLSLRCLYCMTPIAPLVSVRLMFHANRRSPCFPSCFDPFPSSISYVNNHLTRRNPTISPYSHTSTFSASKWLESCKQMPPPDLPGELLDHTVDHLYDARVTLKSCCLVSKSWVPRTRKHLCQSHVQDSSTPAIMEDNISGSLHLSPRFTPTIWWSGALS